MTGQNLHDLRRRTLEGVRLHGELFRWLMTREPWDIFIAGFSAPHCGASFWHYMDPEHPRHNILDPHKLNDTMEAIYCALDEEIAKMLMPAGNEIQCLIISGHGMGPLYHASWNLNEILDYWAMGKFEARCNHARLSASESESMAIVKNDSAWQSAIFAQGNTTSASPR